MAKTRDAVAVRPVAAAGSAVTASAGSGVSRTVGRARREAAARDEMVSPTRESPVPVFLAAFQVGLEMQHAPTKR